MSQDFDGSTIVFLLVLAWVYWNIWLLSQSITRDHQAPDPTAADAVPTGADWIADPFLAAYALPRDDFAGGNGSALAEALSEIYRSDSSFLLSDFIEDATAAYEEIALAFIRGNVERLRAMVSPEVCAAFREIIESRKRDETSDATFIRIAAPVVTAARIAESRAEITLHFVSDLISVTHNAVGSVVSGDPVHAVETVDLWTFAKPLAAEDDDWRLLAANVSRSISNEEDHGRQ